MAPVVARLEAIAGVIGDCLDGRDWNLVYWMPSQRYEWRSRHSLFAESATRALLLEYEAYVHGPLPEVATLSARAEPRLNEETIGTRIGKTDKRRRLERARYVHVRHSLDSDSGSWPAIIRSVTSDQLTVHFVGLSDAHDETLSKLSERVGELVDAAHTGLRTDQSGRWRTLEHSAELEELAPPARLDTSGERALPPSMRALAGQREDAVGVGTEQVARVLDQLNNLAERASGCLASTLGLAAELGDAGTAQTRAVAQGDDDATTAAWPKVESEGVDFALGDTHYTPFLPRSELVGSASALVAAATKRGAADRSEFSVGTRVLSQYRNQWHRCTLVSYEARSGEGSIVYDLDGAFADVKLPHEFVTFLAKPRLDIARQQHTTPPAGACARAHSPLWLGETVICAQGRPWVVTRVLQDEFVILRSRSGSVAIRHESELWAAAAGFALDFQHMVSEVHDERVNNLAKRLGVDAHALVAANRAFVRGISITSMLWSGTLLLLPAPAASAANVRAALDRWRHVERALRMHAHAQRWASSATRPPAVTGKKRATLLDELREEPQPANLPQASYKPQPSHKLQLGHKPQLVLRSPSMTLLAPAYAKRPKGTLPGGAGLTGVLVKPSLPLARSLSLSASIVAARISEPSGSAAVDLGEPYGAHGNLNELSEIEDGPRLLRIMLRVPAQPGSEPEQCAQCIGTVEVLAGMTLCELARSICTDLDVQPGFKLVIGEVPIHEVQYKKQALPFAEGVGIATISYATTEEQRWSPFVPSKILEQYAVAYEPEDATASEEDMEHLERTTLADQGSDAPAAAAATRDHLVAVAQPTLDQSPCPVQPVHDAGHMDFDQQD